MATVTRSRSITQPSRRRKDALQTTTVRDFSGGLSVIDNELKLSSKYATMLDNVLRMPDGTNGVRWGTQFQLDVNDFGDTNGDLDEYPLSTTDTSQVVEVTWAGHPFISGHYVEFDGLVTVGGIPAEELNTVHKVTYVDADTFSITVTTPATATMTGGGTTGTYTYDNKNLDANIVAMTYVSFAGQGFYVVFGDTGAIIVVQESTGAAIRIWDDDIAGFLSGAPTGWSSTSFVSHAQFGGDTTFTSSVIACNGYDKPIEIDLSNTPTDTTSYVRYLVTAENSNTYVPRARYVTMLQDFVVLAGGYNYQAGSDIPMPTTVWIAAKGTKSCFPDEPGGGSCATVEPAAATVDIRRYVTVGDVRIRGIGNFRNRLVIGTERVMILAGLGGTDDSGAVHVPDLSDVVVNYGTLGHRTFQSIGSDFLVLDGTGVPSLTRSQLADTVKPFRRSALIEPLIQSAIRISYKDNVTPMDKDGLADRAWSIYNPREAQYMLFVPNHPDPSLTTEYIGFVYTVNEELDIRAWSRFRGMNFTCGMTTSLDDVLFAEGSKIYKYGSEMFPVYADKLGDPDIADPDTGVGIDFAWETPWSDFDKRLAIKHTRYLGMDTEGDAEFNVDMYVDNLKESVSTGNLTSNPLSLTSGSPVVVVTQAAHGASNGDTVYLEGLTTACGVPDDELNTGHRIHSVTTDTYSITVSTAATSTGTGGGADGRYNVVYLSPALSLTFKGGSAWGYGGPFSSFGGGRITRDERLFAWPAKFKQTKMRFSGSSTKRLRIAAFSFAYLLGGPRI